MKPYIISASRREDIPASPVRMEWLLKVIEEGQFTYENQYGNTCTVDFEKTEFCVFWSKNPRYLLEYIGEIPYEFYLHYTLNDYPEYELNIPNLENRIETFQKISNLIGKERVIWRHDPIIVNQDIDVNEVLRRIYKLGNRLNQYTEKLVFSFISEYSKHNFKTPDQDTQHKVMKGLVEMNEEWNLDLRHCASDIEFEGIQKNKCIDDSLIQRIIGDRPWLKPTKDKGQRKECQCIQSSDVGAYRRCKHNCLYCYAK